MKFALVFCCLWIVGQCSIEWINLPQIPADRRSEYYLLHKDGGYKYGLDTGTGIFAKQSATPSNQVEGHYGHEVDGKVIGVKYTAGIQGFVPEGFSASSSLNFPQNSEGNYLTGTNTVHPDGSYSFSYATTDSDRSEEGDSSGNVRGQYSYTNEGGHHDLSYEAGAEKGFVPTGGSLGKPNGLDTRSSGTPPLLRGSYLPPSGGLDNPSTSVIGSTNLNADGSYSFSYSTADSSRQESGEASGNVQGQYSYRNDAGHHDLSYKAGDGIGFVPTGGTLSTSNGLDKQGVMTTHISTRYNSPIRPTSNANLVRSESRTLNPDGSYSFSYATTDSDRSEEGDSSGNVRGQYSYTNEAGHHDLSYEAGAEKGFVPTGGSLAKPNGLDTTSSGTPPLLRGSYLPPSGGLDNSSTSEVGSNNLNADGSYSFSYSTADSSRKESGDASGNVRGQYSYRNDARHHDLSYKAGDEIGFVPTGGTLSTPNGLNNQETVTRFISTANNSPLIGTGNVNSVGIETRTLNPDGSYSFSYKTANSERSENGDANGNVQGHYSFRNENGFHDLSYIAKADTGFVPTGGNLAISNGLSSSISGDFPANGNVQGQFSYNNEGDYQTSSFKTEPEIDVDPRDGNVAVQNDLGREVGNVSSDSNNINAIGTNILHPDGSYSFSYTNQNSTRSESGDANGNVQGQYSYENEGGNHDLSYKAGAEIGFVPVGGSLATPIGLQGLGTLKPHNRYLPSSSESNSIGRTSITNQDGTFSIPYATGSLEGAHQQNMITQPSKIHRDFGNLKVVDLLPVSENHKVGYVLN